MDVIATSSKEDVYNEMMANEEKLVQAANKVSSVIQEERARKKRYSEMSAADMLELAVKEWKAVLVEGLHVKDAAGMWDVLAGSADRKFFVGIMMVLAACVLSIVWYL